MTSIAQDAPQQVEEIVRSRIPLPEDLAGTAFAIPHSKEKGFSHVYRNSSAQDALISTPYPTLDTLRKLFQHSVLVHGDKDCLGARPKLADGTYGPYVFQTYKTIESRQLNFGSGLYFILENNPFRTEVHQDVRYGGDFIVSLFSDNRPEWAIADLACSSFSLTNTALYTTLGPDTTKYILNLTSSPVVVCSKDKLEFLIGLKKEYPEELALLIALVSMDPLTHGEQKVFTSDAKDANILLFDMEQVEALGAVNKVLDIPPKADTVYTISFTSGTTGANPKGVVLTHRNAVSGVTFSISKADSVQKAKSYSFLPLAHIYERTNLLVSLFMGAAIGYPSVPVVGFLDDVKSLLPHVLALVPRVLTRLEAAIKAETVQNEEKPVIKSVFSWAINNKMDLQSSADNEKGNHFLYDRPIGLLRKKLGFSNLLFMATGSAPLSPETIKFLKAALGIGIAQGYGLTESFGGICSSLKYEANPGSCGSTSITTEMRLKDVPEMNYFSDDEIQHGELLLRGPQIFSHYYKNDEETEKAFEDGWFRTGDIARIERSTGKVFIIDRLKNFFKLSQGEYVTPEKIENTYLSRFPYILQVFVYGNSLQSYLVGIVGLDPDTLASYTKRKFGREMTPQDAVEFFKKSEHKKALLLDMNASLLDSLLGFERMHNIYVDFDPLNAERNVVTPTMKIKRPIATNFFKETLDKLYEEGSLIANSTNL